MWSFCIACFAIGVAVLLLSICKCMIERVTACASANTTGVVHGVKAGLIHAGNVAHKS